MKQIFKIFLLAVILYSFTQPKVSENGSNMGKQNPPTWQQVYPGVWKSIVNEPSKLNLLNSVNAKPRAKALAKMEDADFPFEFSEIKASSKKHKTFLRFPLENDEQIYGFGLNFKTVQQRGRIMRLHVDHYGGQDNGRTHAPTPFFVSTKGYGVLINSAKYIDVYVGTGVTKNSENPAKSRDRNTDKNWNAQPKSDNIELVIPDTGVELILFAGNSIQEIVQRYNLYCGGGFIPPKWGLGFWQRTPTLYNEKDVLKEIKGFEKNNFPLDVVGLEPGWHSNSYPCTFEWDKTRFPDPKKFVQKVSDNGIHLNSWINPYVSPDAKIYKDIAPFTGSHTVWTGLVPDFNMPEARKIMTDQFQEDVLSVGVSGLKIDEVDGFDNWLWPDNATFPSGIDGETMRCIYGLQVQKWSTDMFRKNNTRTYGLVRASNAGGVSFPYVIYNDYYKHEDFITALINSSFSGVLWTPEVRHSESSEEWVRRMQSVCFSPMAMINAWADGTKPWSYPDVYKYCQDVANLRMQLLPYLYTAFSEYYLKGIPPFRAMVMEPGFDHKTLAKKGKLSSTLNPYAMALKKEVKDQYMMGKYLLVAPMFKGQKSRKVILPQGKWYDFYTGKFVGDGKVITAKYGLDKIPLYVKDGGIIPMMPAMKNTTGWLKNVPIEVRVYGHAPEEYLLYNDDGQTYNYEIGEYTQQLLKVFGKNGKLDGLVIPLESGGNWAYKDIKWKFMSK
ncbi:MAG: ABC transporter substrate-binding protein [Bacteroidetes bacterium]|nr:MAG: ABC transporter substrate-binding protein [Bacteroidota bacterium]